MVSAEHISFAGPTLGFHVVSKGENTFTMKTFSSLLIIFMFLISCEGSDDATLVGKWTIKDYYLSPGTNNVSYQKATSGWTLEFLEDGTVRSNQKLCAEPAAYDGIYDGHDIIGNGCAPVYYYRLEGRYLIVGGKNCIEGCQSRFLKNISSLGG